MALGIFKALVWRSRAGVMIFLAFGSEDWYCRSSNEVKVEKDITNITAIHTTWLGSQYLSLHFTMFGVLSDNSSN